MYSVITFFKMEILMKEIGLKEKRMEKEFLSIIMEMNMKENFYQAKKKEKGN